MNAKHPEVYDAEAVLNAYGLLEGASTYGRRQAIKAAMDALRPLVDREIGRVKPVPGCPLLGLRRAGVPHRSRGGPMKLWCRLFGHDPSEMLSPYDPVRRCLNCSVLMEPFPSTKEAKENLP